MDDGQAKSPKTKVIKVKVATADMMAEVAEARGLAVWEVVESLVAAQLPAVHKAIQPQLKKVREYEAKKAEVQEQARRDRAG